MIDSQTGKKIEYMEVAVTVKVDVSGCKTSEEMYNLSAMTVADLGRLIRPAYEVHDWYEAPRVEDEFGCEIQADPVDEV